MDFFEHLGKVIADEFKTAIKHTVKQLDDTSGRHTPYRSQKYLFTKNFHTDAEEWGLSEADAVDVYNHGQKTSDDTFVREYNGYEIGIEFSMDSITGLPIIDEIWKKNK